MDQQTTLLTDYSLPERSAYLSALATIAAADGTASNEELEFLSLLGQAAELPQQNQEEVLQIARNPSQVSLQACLDQLKGSQLRFSFITDIISFAKSDGQYSPQERERIQDMAAYLEINPEQFRSLDEFVDSAGTAQQRGEDPASPTFLQQSGFADRFKNLNISPGMIKGVLGMLAPLVISRLAGSRRGGLGGGLLGSLLGGGAMSGRSGGLGSLIAMLGGLGGRPRYGGMNSGGLGSLLGGILGGSRKGGGLGW
ncbi:TerB family tellurite resistance protein [Fibrella aquatica]|uniref:tellurite resistance TerB family protein n=1 Tax=Fibrella aquatica TaxID=3242487 RepID=UPI0035213560